MRAPSFLLLLTLATGCVLEDKPLDAGGDAGPDASPDSGECGGCFDPTPVCVEGVGCVPCTADEDEYCTDQMLVCKTDEMECVDCLQSSDCNDASLAHCNTDTNECEECMNDTDCDGIEGLSVCDAGECVQCTPAREGDKCGDKSCDPATHMCTTTVVGSQDVCETCVADSECGDEGAPSPSHRCVEMEYQGDPFPGDGTGFCLKTTEGGCEQPYSITLSDRTSLSGHPLRRLLRHQRAARDLPRCTSTGAECKHVLVETRRLPSQAGFASKSATYRIGARTSCGLRPRQCPADPPANTCGASGSGGDDYCGG